MKQKHIKKRLEYLRGELRGARISYGELSELQSLAPHITPGDVELLEAAGVPEFPEKASGEWHVVERNGTLEIAEFDCTDEFPRSVIATVHEFERNPCEDHTNAVKNAARLIAAAPELLEALQNLIAIADDPENAKDRDFVDQIDFNTIRAALAKATGGES